MTDADGIKVAQVVTGVLYGYLPFEGLMEIKTAELAVVQLFAISGEVRANLMENPDCYVHLINRMVLASVHHKKIVKLRLAPRP